MTGSSLRELRQAVLAGPPYSEAFLAMLRADGRAGARALYAVCLTRVSRARCENGHDEAMMAFEREAAANGFRRVAGVDEAGRGPLAGPIVAAAVVLAKPVPGLDDSKRLTRSRRDALHALLTSGGHGVGVAVLEPAEIDRAGIQNANYAAMQQAAMALAPSPDFLLVDGFRIPGCAVPHERIVKGDARSASIAAASVVAKVTRDRLMDTMDERYPGYGFARHKGYATEKHLEALERLGPCPIHRRSFAPLAQSAETALLFEDHP